MLSFLTVGKSILFDGFVKKVSQSFTRKGYAASARRQSRQRLPRPPAGGK